MYNEIVGLVNITVRLKDMNSKNLGYLLITLMILSIVSWEYYEDEIPHAFTSVSDIPFLAAVSVFIGPISAMTLWFWMIGNVIKNKELKNRWPWIATLVILNWIASIFYFLLVYRKTIKAV